MEDADNEMFGAEKTFPTLNIDATNIRRENTRPITDSSVVMEPHLSGFSRLIEGFGPTGRISKRPALRGPNGRSATISTNSGGGEFGAGPFAACPGLVVLERFHHFYQIFELRRLDEIGIGAEFVGALDIGVVAGS